MKSNNKFKPDLIFNSFYVLTSVSSLSCLAYWIAFFTIPQTCFIAFILYVILLGLEVQKDEIAFIKTQTDELIKEINKLSEK